MALAYKTVQRVGNSTGILLPPEILRDAGIERGDEVLVTAERGQIRIVPVSPVRAEVMEGIEWFISNHADALRKLAE